MITRTLSKWAGCLPLLVLFACASISSADDILGPIWENDVPAQMPVAVTPDSQAGTAIQAQTSAAAQSMSTLDTFSTLSLVSGPSATAITPELQALASGLNNDPVKIFNYVRNKIAFQPYYGSHKGAHTTYLDGAGNDMDQASLLIALLNQAGYSTTSYVYGKYVVRDTSPDGIDLSHWVGTTPTLAPNVLFSNKVPVYTGTSHGTYIMWPFDHVWVRATINGTSYDLDPSYKLSQSFSGIDFKTASGYSRSQLLADAGGTATSDYAQNLNRTKVESDLSAYTATLRNYIKANAPNADMEQIIGGWRIREQSVTTLSQGAPPSYCSPTVSTTFTSIPTKYIATYRVQMGAIDSTFNADSLQGNRLSLVFSSGTAQLWLGDTMAAQDTSAGGTTISGTLSLSHPTSSGFQTKTLNAVSYLRTGNYDLTCTCYANSRSTGQIDASNLRLQNYLASGKTDSSREVLTETLHSLGLKWVRRVNLVAAITGQVRGCYSGVMHIFGRTGQEAGYYVDMPGVGSTIMNEQGADYLAFNAFAALSSAMEHGVIEQNGGSASVSTIKCLVLANDGGQKIFRATSANYSSTVSPALTNYSQTQTSNFSGSVSSGYILLLHQNGQTVLNQWNGFGYSIISGSSAGMIIAGGYSGGYSSQQSTASGVAATLINTASSNVPSPTKAATSSNVSPTLSLEPVDLLSGAYTMEHADLTLGEQNSPRGLNFTRYYDSSRNFQSSALGNGWRHSCEGKISLSSELDMAFGLTQPTDAAQTIVGVLSVTDFVDTSYTPKELLVGALAANWTVNRITNNVANVQIGNQFFPYVSQSDGSWNPPPGTTAVLTGSNSAFMLLPRFGGRVVFDGSNRISQWKDVDNNTQTYAYTSGSLSTVTDKWGRTLTFTYNTSGAGNGLLQKVTDSTGRVVQFTYTSGTYSGANLTGITDPENYQTTLIYDGRNRLTDWKDNANTTITHNDYDILNRVYQQLSQGLSNHKWQFLYSPGVTLEIDPQGDTTAHLFDYKNRNAGIIDALANASSIGYDSQNHVTQIVDATGIQTTSLYDSDQNLRTVTITGTDNSVKTTTYQYDGSLRLWKVIDPTGRYTMNEYYDGTNHLKNAYDTGGRKAQYFYRADGLLDHVIDPAGNTTSYTAYDTYGNPTNVTRGDGATTSATFNARGDRLTFTDGRNKTTQYTYDKRRLLKTQTDAHSKVTTWIYDANGYLQSVTDRNNHMVSTPNDNLGHIQTMTATDTATVTYGYDTRDWRTTVTDGLNHATTTYYDAAGRQSTLVNALSITTGSTSYDAAGRVSVQYDGLNHATRYFYDGAGRLDHTLDPLNHTVYHSYDDAGRPLTLQNQRSKTFVFGYAPTDGLATTFTYPSGRQSQIIDREAGGLPRTLQSPSGNQTIFTYEGMRRAKTSTDSLGQITWYYDGEGNATDVVETGGTTHRIFDELGRVTSCTDIQGNTLGYGYDNEGNVASITYPGNKTVSYTYDGSNRLKTVTDWAGRLTTYYYDTVGRLDHVDRPNSTRQRVVFDNANRIANGYEEKIGGGTLWQAGYGFDNADRLTSYTPSPAAKTVPPPSVLMTYDSDNRIATYNGQTVNHDLDGNLQSAPVQGTLLGALGWDKRNRLTSAGGVTYIYDAENRRIGSIKGGQTTTYVYSRSGSLDRLLLKQNPDGSITRYVYGDGLLYEETTNAQGVVQSPVYYHYNWRGDTIALSDPSGNVAARLSYSPYGERTIESGTVTTPFCFNGKWGVITESNGLFSMQARYYSPILRRFLNEDPSGFNGGTNLYAYTSGDPIDLMDPFGLGQASYNFSLGGTSVSMPNLVLNATGVLAVDTDGLLTTQTYNDLTHANRTSSRIDYNGNYVPRSQGISEINANTDMYAVVPQSLSNDPSVGGNGVAPLGTKIVATNQNTGVSVQTQIADYGPDPSRKTTGYGEGSIAFVQALGGTVTEGFKKGKSIGPVIVGKDIPVTIKVYLGTAPAPSGRGIPKVNFHY